MELQVKDEYLARVESLYYLAVENALAERKEADRKLQDQPWDKREDNAPFLLSGAIEKRFIELVAVDMRQQVENTHKSYERKMGEIKDQLNRAFVSPPPEPAITSTQKIVEKLCGQEINDEG